MSRAAFAARAALAALCGLTSAAGAQSKRYPPVAPDPELVEERRSKLWEATLHPDLGPYKALIKEAKQLLGHGTAADVRAGLDKLDAAIRRAPGETEAYVLRGGVALNEQRWPACADDLAAADLPSRDEDATARAKLRLDLGICQARAGRLAEAERTLAAAASSARTHRGELWLRLGEVRIALGKLDEAIDALLAATETGETNDVTRWLLALAYDRARRPGDAQEHAQNAKRWDQSLGQIQSPRLPHLGAGDAEYLYGIAYRYALLRPEYALVYFRRFLAVAADSPWRRRAEEHVRELSAIRFPSKDTLAPSGSAAVVLDTARASLEKPVIAMRACLGKLPMAVYQVSVTKVGPRTNEGARDRPIFRVPPADATATLVLNIDPRVTGSGGGNALADAAACIKAVAAKAPLVQPKDRDTFYRLSFYVVSP